MADALFTPPPAESRSSMRLPLLVGGGVVLLVVVLLLVFGHHKVEAPTTVAPLDAYATSLPLSSIEMSEATSPFAGGRSTYIDGKVTNNGDKTVTGISVQTIFKADDGQTVSLQTVPLTLIRTREPYVDTQPVSIAPVAPGASAEFRLIFEGLPQSWNQKQPELRIVGVQSK
ncbi:DUF2393 domain-containing protein [Terriglobus tenax]|uniref:DUF2393 domain-containing protein n=1 Tax=Terriglobus tenax TaxID=1111115 RepID=UPI0021DF6CDF|nr:DUF2393 domain-containing protein [Terriglobus tenax]